MSLILQDYTSSSILSAVDGKSPSTDIDLFSDYTAVGSLTRNTNSWAHNFTGITGIIAWNSRSQGEPDGTQINGAAVTKRHIIYSKHASYQAGNTVYFVTKDNTLVTREIVAVKNYPNSWASGDYGIGLLESDLPDSIEPLKVFQKDVFRYFDVDDFTSPTSTTWEQPTSVDKEVLILNTNQQEKVSIRRLTTVLFKNFTDPNPDSYTTDSYGFFRARTAAGSIAQNWDVNIIPGDSGSPVMMLLDNEVVLIGLWSYVGAGPFLSTPRNYNDINRMITDVDTTWANDPSGFPASGYTLTNIDLSNYYAFKPVNFTATTLPLSSTSLAVFEKGVSPSYDITWSFTYEVKNWVPGDDLGFSMFLQDAAIPLSGGGIGDDLGYSGSLSGQATRFGGMSGGVLGVGLDTQGVFALKKDYENGLTRDGLSLSARKFNSISIRGDEASGYQYQDSNIAISAFDILSDGKKTLRSRLGNYGRTIYVDYKEETDLEFTNLLTKDINELTFDINTLYRPGITISKPLTANNSNIEVLITNFHVEGKTLNDTLSNTHQNEFNPLSVFSIDSNVLGPPAVALSLSGGEGGKILPFLGMEPNIGCPNEYCGLSADNTTVTGFTFPTSILYSLSATIGTVDIQANNTSNIPIRFVLNYDDEIILDTGYNGSQIYNYGGTQRQTFINSLKDKPPQPNVATAADGYPVVTTVAPTISSFFKDTDKSRAIFDIYNPLSATGWEVFLSCPIREVNCNEDVFFECGLYRIYPAETKVNTN